jgi:menaquinol-cytochrome c reductase iron-sulfur subunit
MTHPSTPIQPERRTFLHWLTYTAGAVAAAVLSVPLIGFLFGALRKRREEWLPLGPVTDYPEGQTRLVTFDNPLKQPWDGMTAHTGVFVRNLGQGQFRILAVNCAHLGCPVSWFPQSALFMCPCHGGVYYEDGSRASGPPPRGLFPCPSKIEDGKLWVQAPHYPSLHDTLRKPANT